MRRVPFAMLGVLLSTSAGIADVIHVPGDYPTIQAAIDAAANGDEIVVAPGTYGGSVDLRGKAVELRSVDGPDSTSIVVVGGPAITCASGEGPQTVIDGFRITGFGGLVNDGASPTILNCDFVDCHASIGGGIVNWFDSAPLIVNCRFIGNSVSECFESLGGGMYTIASSDALAINCIFWDNDALGTSCTGEPGIGRGGGMCGGTAVNCVFVGNYATDGGSAAYGSILRNCIVWSNGPSPVQATSVAFSLVQSPDPRFVAPGVGDFRLRLDSPCIDAGNTTLLPLDEFDLDGDLDVSELFPFDMDGNPRVTDTIAVPDAGVPGPTGLTVDMGAFECQPPPCPADTDGSGVVDVDDLIAVLQTWGAQGDGLAGDVNGNGQVDVDDLVLVILAWGPCFDCNDNGVLDLVDIASGTSEDCNGSLVPDECELGANDCNENAVPDECDIANGQSGDLDGNGVPDECQSDDCNGNGVSDLVDIASGTSGDCNGSLVPDECELEANDCNENGIPDECDSVLPNDTCGTATTLYEGQAGITTCVASGEGLDETLCGMPITNDVWFRHLAHCDGTLALTVDADFEAIIVVYVGPCPGSTSDQAIACGPNEVTFDAAAGSIYRFRVGSPDGSSGSGTITLTCGP